MPRPNRRRLPVFANPLPALAGFVAVAGVSCSRPFTSSPADPLERVVAETARREALPQPDEAPTVALEASETPVEAALAPRRSELDALGPQVEDAGPRLDVGDDLLGGTPPQTALALQEAIAAAVRHNLGVQIARVDQAIGQSEIVKAEAIFDAVVFAGTGFGRTDEPGQSVFVSPPGGGAAVEVNPGGTDSRLFTYEAGLRQFLPSGATVSVTAAGSRSENLLPDLTLSPNPAWESSLTLSLAQPLLRGFGGDVNTARVALARNADRRSLQALRERLLAVVADTEAAYWTLVLARQRLAIREWLVDVGEDVRDILERRQQLDVTLADFADAVATVESRKAEVIRARRDVGIAVDRLKALINDPRLPLGGERSIVPADWMVSTPLEFDLGEVLATAVRESPAVQQAILAIDDAAIRELVADNGRLPQLDLAAEMAYFGLGGTFGDGWNEMGQANFIDYVVGLQFSQPIGNRAAEAEYRQARLRRSGAVLRYRQTIQETVLAVRIALRDVVAAWQLIGQTRASRTAAAENLRALRVLERTRASLTPEFLNLKFQRQNGLALAQASEVAALAEYNVAIANLQRAMGTGLEMNRIEIALPDAGETAGMPMP